MFIFQPMKQRTVRHSLADVVVLLAGGLIMPVSRASADKVDSTFPVGDYPEHAAINPAGTFAYVIRLPWVHSFDGGPSF